MSTPRTIRFWWEDFPAGSVREFGAKPVTRDAVIAFAAEFDPQPFHLDDEAAEASLFGRLSASGWRTRPVACRPRKSAKARMAAVMVTPIDQPVLKKT